MINFHAAEDVLKFFEEKGAREPGNVVSHAGLITDLIQEKQVTFPWVVDGLTALAYHMKFIVPVGGDKNRPEPDAWKLTAVGSRAIYHSKECGVTNRG